jgi:hypothetical protein
MTTEVYGAVQYDGSSPVPPPEWRPAVIPDSLWIASVDPGATTGLCIAAIPRDCIYGSARSSFLYREAFELTGSLREQVKDVCWYARQCYMFGQNARTARNPLIVCEDFDLGGNRLQGAASQADVVIPVRFAAALRYAVECGHADHCRLLFQGRTIAFSTMTDDRLKKAKMWDVGSDHKRDATRHLITALRRIREGSIDPEDVWDV